MKTSTIRFLSKFRISRKLLYNLSAASFRNFFTTYRALFFFITLCIPCIAAATGGNSCQVISHTSFNNFKECYRSSSPTTLWINVHTKLNKQLTKNGDYVLFSGGNLSFSGISCSFGSSASLPNGKIIADHSVNAPTTSFHSSSNTWITRVPLSYSSNDIFICGGAVTSNSGFKITWWNKYTTLKGSFSSNRSFSSSWFYGLALYQPTFNNYNVGSVNSVYGIPVWNHKAGTPNDQKHGYVGGGSNGSYCSYDNFTACYIPSAPDVDVTQPNCSKSTGTINVTSPTGYGYSYSINGYNYQYSTYFSGVSPGTYNVTVKKDGGVKSVATVVVINNVSQNPPAPTVHITQPTCSNTKGSITVTWPTGNEYTYSINGTNYQSGTTFYGLSPGTYYVTVKNYSGCVSHPTKAIVHPQPPAPGAPAITITQPNCYTPKGTITVTYPTGSGFTYSIDGYTYQTSTTFSGLAAGTYYVTVKNSAGCTSISSTVAVINPAPASPEAPDVYITQPTCEKSTGTIIVTSPTGNGYTYSINGSNYQSGTSFYGLAPGKYYVTVKNYHGCVSYATIAIINPQPPKPDAPSVTITQPSCSVPTGTITVTSPTGSGYTYSINGGAYQSGTTFSGLTSGSYKIAVKNSAGCTSVKENSVYINEPSPPPSAPTVAITHPTCIKSTGSITVTSPTGAGYTYSINGYSYQSGTTFNALEPGTYYVTVKNSAGCVSASEVAVINTQPEYPDATTVYTTQATCTISTGTIYVTAPAGSGYTYSIDGDTYQSSGTFSQVSPGTYYVTAKNRSGCISSATVAVIDPQPPKPSTPTVRVTQPTCSEETGSITVTSPTGSGYSYSINGGSYQSGTTFSGLSAGTYIIKVKNSNGCISVNGATVVIYETPGSPDAPEVSITQPTCSKSTGTIKITAPTGAGYTYSIDGSTYQEGTTFSNVAPGTYYVTAMNGSGCVSASKIVIIKSQPSRPSTPIVILKQPTCLVSTGTITVTSPTGSGYTYSIDGNDYQASATFSGLSGGTYEVTVKNSNGCTSVNGTTVVIKNSPSAVKAPVVSVTQPTCSVSTGKITVTSPTGSAFTYSINGSTYQSGTVFSGLSAGTYYVTVKSSGCISGSTKVVINTKPTPPSTPTIVISQPNCAVSTGTITVTIPLGSSYKYSINGSTYQSGATFTGVAEGTYYVTVKNSAGCISGSRTAVINTAPETTTAPVVSLTQPTCTNAKGTIKVTAPIGSGFTYSINGSTYQTGTTFSNVSAGTYYVTVKCKSGCISAYTKVILKVPSGTPPGAPSVSVTMPGCNCSSGSIKVIAPVGSGYTYSINGSTYQSGTTFSGLSIGTYYVTVKSSTGCGVSAPTKAVITLSASAAAARSSTPFTVAPMIEATSVTVFPNPYLTELNFTIKPSVSGRGSVVLFDFVGKKIATVFEGDFKAGIQSTVLFRINATQRQPMIYIFKIGEKTFHGKLLPGAL